MENFDAEFIASLLNEENMYPNKRDLLIRYFKRYSSKHGISKRILRIKLENLVVEPVEEARFKSRRNNVY